MTTSGDAPSGSGIAHEPRHEPVGDEPVGVHGRPGLERDRRRQQAVVQRDDHRAPVTEVQADRPAGIESTPSTCHGASIVCVMPSLGEVAQRREVDGRLGEPHPGGPATEPDLEIAQAPADLGPAVRGRRERQDGVVERLGHPVGPAVALDEAAIRDRIARLEPAGQRRPDVPRDRPEVAGLRVGSIAVGADALVPVPRRRRGRVERHRAAERIDPRRLVEVPVDDELRSGHAPSAVRSWAVVIRWRTMRSQRSPGPRCSGHESSSPLPW